MSSVVHGGALIRALAVTRARWSLALVSVVLGAGAVCAAGALLGVSGYLISRAAQHPEILTLGVAIVGVRFFGITRALLRYLERLVSHDLAFRSLTDLRVRFFARLVPLVPAGIPGIGSADLLSRFVTDADRLQDLYLRGVGPPAIAVLAGGVGLIAVYLILPVAALAIGAVLVLGGLAAPLLTRLVARRAGARQAGARSIIATELAEIVRGAPEIAIAGREAEWQRRADSSDVLLARLMRRDALAHGLAGGFTEMIAAGAAVLMLVLAVPAVAAGDISGVLLAALVLIALASVEAVAPLGPAAASLDAVATAAARLECVTDRPPPVEEPQNPIAVPASGSLAMRGVTFAYDGGRTLLREADLWIEPGTAVALVGPSGIGKSTLAELFVHFRDPQAGRIELGGVDVRRLAGEEVRRDVRLAPQDCYVFATTIRANLALASPRATDERMREALVAVGLGEWLAHLPDGLDTTVGEAGAKVSGGQRQRIAVARLLLCDARFLIFDEPTTHLDGAARRRVLAAIVDCAHRRGKGVLVVTHDRDSLASFDEVHTLLPNGRTTSGSHTMSAAGAVA